MSFSSWWRQLRTSGQRALVSSAAGRPLREFVYLDAVSLHSLLVSQNHTIPDEVSQAISRADQAELSATVAAEAIVAKSQVGARYQTSNSNTLQSSRKAVIQTLFKEFRDLPLGFKLASRGDADPFKNVDEIRGAESPSVERASELVRGTLVEVEVQLDVDPVFKLASMMSEYSAMADEYPAMFGAQGVLGFLHESQPVMKVMDRFMAGLIPIKATAVDVVVVDLDGDRYLVNRRSIQALKIDYRPLTIVGVTEHLGYWKDIRRILFSGAKFTMMCRVARDGVHESWTPIKLADLFKDVAPDLVNQINSIEMPGAETAATNPGSQQLAFGRALKLYALALLSADEADLDVDADLELKAVVSAAEAGPTDALAQRRAFDQVRARLERELSAPPTPSADLGARQAARVAAGLELFPSLLGGATSPPGTADKVDRSAERLLDVEVIAIYW